MYWSWKQIIRRLKIFSMKSRWIGPLHYWKGVFSNNNYLVRKIGANKTQVLDRTSAHIASGLTFCQTSLRYEPCQEKWKLDPEVSLKHECFYAMAGRCEYEKPIFAAKNYNVTPPISPEVALQSGSPTGETWIKPGTARECSREFFPRTE